MNKLLQGTLVGLAAVGAVGAISVLDGATARAQGSATVGALRGQIRDKASGEGALGATVVATSPALVGEQVVLTDESGLYYITSLPPGVYTLTVYYENKTFSRGNVLIQLGKEAVVNVTVDPAAGSAAGGAGAGEVIEISGTVPIVDQGSTKTGITITDDYTRNIPVGRTFGGTVEASAGSQVDTYGISISGATSAENVYVVEGINTTDTAFGGISSNLPTEFIQETEVITGGYNAEFGRATGGIVNVITKSGSNQLRGSVFGYYRPGALFSDAEVIPNEGASLNSEANVSYNWDVGAELGGPIIKDKLWFHVGFNPSSTKTVTTRTVAGVVDDDQDGVADIDPNTGFTIRNEIAGSARDLTSKLDTYFFTAKINGAISANHQFSISGFGNPRTGEAVSGILTRNPNGATFQNDDGAYDLAGKWTSKFNDGKTQIDAVLGFHRGYDKVAPNAGVGEQALVLYNYERSLYDFADIEGGDAIGYCNDNDPDDPYPNLVNCPVTGYRSQGLGFVEDRTNDRYSAVLSATQRVKAFGYHTFKAGIEVEQATYDSTRGFTGGASITRFFPGTGTRNQIATLLRVIRTLGPDEDPAQVAMNLPEGQVICIDGNAVCERTNEVSVSAVNRTYAAYIQDSWQIRPNLTVNGGLRFEQQNGFVSEQLQGLVSPEGEVIPERAYQLNQIAPRLGLIWDPTSEGKSKVFAHWGRFYENVPMDINVRAFGGEIQDQRFYNASDLAPGDMGYDPNCDVDYMPGQDLLPILQQCDQTRLRRQLGGATEYVSPGLKAQFTQELVLGTEYEIFADFKFGINYIRRTLPTVIEDISTDGGNNYLITNPGADLTSEANDLRAQAAELMMSTDPQQQALGELYASRADQLDSVKRFDKPIRTYNGVQFQATQRFTPNSLLIATYTYSQSKGNYPGLFSTETGQLDPNLTSLYDLPDLMANRYGNMGLDRPHNLKVDGFYAFDLKKAGIVTVGASFRALSGLPQNTLVAHPIYGEDEAFLLPRGDIGRTPVTKQIDTHFAYGYQLNKTTRLEGFVRIFNLFNEQDETNSDARYSVDFANPIVGGDISDLDHSKTVDPNSGLELNRSLTPNKNYLKVSGRQAPRNVQLGFRLTF